MDFNLNEAYIYSLMSMPRGQNTTEHFNNTCNLPYKVMSVDSYCNVMLCVCSGWLPLPVGNILDFDNLEDVWANPRAKYLQQNVDDKKYNFCATEHCGITKASMNESKYQVLIGIDNSCNLACPSCRKELMMHSVGPEFEKKQKSAEHLVKLLENFNKPIHISLSSTGDPLASHIYRPFVKNYTPKAGQSFTLTTNGLLIKKQLDDSKIFPAITRFSISVDAGSPEIYHDVRRPGRWDVLLDNLKYLSDKNKSNITQLNFCVQQKNFRDIPKFVELCKEYEFTANIHQLDDWGTWNKIEVNRPDVWTIKNGNFVDHNVLSQTHPEFNECIDICKQISDQKLSFVKFSPNIELLIK